MNTRLQVVRAEFNDRSMDHLAADRSTLPGYMLCSSELRQPQRIYTLTFDSSAIDTDSSVTLLERLLLKIGRRDINLRIFLEGNVGENWGKRFF